MSAASGVPPGTDHHAAEPAYESIFRRRNLSAEHDGARGDTLETECARGSRLLRIVGGEAAFGGPSLAPEQSACEMKGGERLHRRRHRQCRTSEHEACDADAIDRPFDGGERRVKGADLLVIERTLEPKAVEMRRASMPSSSLAHAASHGTVADDDRFPPANPREICAQMDLQIGDHGPFHGLVTV